MTAKIVPFPTKLETYGLPPHVAAAIRAEIAAGTWRPPPPEQLAKTRAALAEVIAELRARPPDEIEPEHAQ